MRFGKRNNGPNTWPWICSCSMELSQLPELCANISFNWNKRLIVGWVCQNLHHPLCFNPKIRLIKFIFTERSILISDKDWYLCLKTLLLLTTGTLEGQSYLCYDLYAVLYIRVLFLVEHHDPWKVYITTFLYMRLYEGWIIRYTSLFCLSIFQIVLAWQQILNTHAE